MDVIFKVFEIWCKENKRVNEIIQVVGDYASPTLLDRRRVSENNIILLYPIIGFGYSIKEW